MASLLLGALNIEQTKFLNWQDMAQLLGSVVSTIVRGRCEPVFQELNLRLIFTLRPEFIEVCTTALTVSDERQRVLCEEKLIDRRATQPPARFKRTLRTSSLDLVFAPYRSPGPDRTDLVVAYFNRNDITTICDTVR